VRLPAKNWDIAVRATGTVGAGDTVTLVDDAGDIVGEAQVESVEDGAGETTLVTINSVVTESVDGIQRDPTEASRLESGGFVGAIDNPLDVNANPIFEQIYLQAAAAAVVILVGAVLVYALVGVRKRTVDFLVATDGEMKKVNWSSKRDVYRSTIVVIVASVLIAGGLFVVDLAFSRFFTVIGVLEGQ
jgi:preprotein translocase SecE subunit